MRKKRIELRRWSETLKDWVDVPKKVDPTPDPLIGIFESLRSEDRLFYGKYLYSEDDVREIIKRLKT